MSGACTTAGWLMHTRCPPQYFCFLTVHASCTHRSRGSSGFRRQPQNGCCKRTRDARLGCRTTPPGVHRQHCMASTKLINRAQSTNARAISAGTSRSMQLHNTSTTLEWHALELSTQHNKQPLVIHCQLSSLKHLHSHSSGTASALVTCTSCRRCCKWCELASRF